MQPLRVRIDRIVDFGTVVSLVGVDIETAMAVTIHVDDRPFTSFWEAWRKTGFSQPIEYAAHRLILHLDMLPAEDAEGAQLVELDGSGASTLSNDRRAGQEMDQ
jgi:hypothetical protein